MSLVVEQTLPYNSSELKLDDPGRWSRLFPLIRPSVKTIKTEKGHTIVVDHDKAKAQPFQIAVIGNPGSFSGKVLESNVSAFVAHEVGTDKISAEDLWRVMSSEGLAADGLVILKVASKRNVEYDGSRRKWLQVEVIGEVELDHVLSLLASGNTDTKSKGLRWDDTKSVLENFFKSAQTTKSTFHHEKRAKDVPSVFHAEDLAEFNSAKAAIDKDLSSLLSSIPSTTDVVYSVHFSDVNGLSRLETNILAHEISEYLARKELPSFISHSSILDHHDLSRGWSISICPVSTKVLSAQKRPSKILLNSKDGTTPSSKPREATSKVQFSDIQVRSIITAGCKTVIADEPTITEYDTIVGDGDCGYTLRDGAKQVLNFINSRDLTQLPSKLSDLVDDLEVNMGGTSGALYCIFLSSLAQQLWGAPTFADALNGSLNDLLKYTTARLGDRTCLDCLIPFVETLKETGDAKKALEEAQKGVETTKKLEAKLGRSSYLDEAATRGVPDPGAYGLLKLLEGMVGAK